MGILNDRGRLVLEARAMRERWGDAATLCRNPENTLLWWEHVVQVEGNEIPIRVVYPDDYPASPPEIVFGCNLPRGTPHVWPKPRTIMPGYRMCWYYPGEQKRTRNVWNPATDTAAVAVAAAYRWCLAFVVWLSTEQWPVPDAVETH
jgi:hypothetical protein